MPTTSSLLTKGKKKLGKPMNLKKKLLEGSPESKLDILQQKLTAKKEMKATWTFSSKNIDKPKQEEPEPTSPFSNMPGFKSLVLKAQLNHKKMKLM